MTERGDVVSSPRTPLLRSRTISMTNCDPRCVRQWLRCTRHFGQSRMQGVDALRHLCVDGLKTASPMPVVTGNQIYGNDNWNFQVLEYAAGAQNLKLNATGNWWGSTDPPTTRWKDRRSQRSLPRDHYSFRGFLRLLERSERAAGARQLSHRSACRKHRADGWVDVTTWSGASRAGRQNTCSVPAGATLRFHQGATIEVDGALTA